MLQSDHNSENKNRKILIFLSIQPIPDLSCKFEHKKKVEGFAPYQKIHQGSENFF